MKPCKKYGRGAGLAEPMTNLYLGPGEYDILGALPGRIVRKRRYNYCGGALDVYAGRSLVLSDVEFMSEEEARRYAALAFTGREVAGDERDTEAYLAAHAV